MSPRICGFAHLQKTHHWCWVPVPETGKWEPRPVLLLDVVLLVFQVHVVARQQEGHAHATLAHRVGAASQCLLLTVPINTCTAGTVLYTIPIVFTGQV
jgi:hypothetical protein